MAEQGSFKPHVEGSNPSAPTNTCVAQLGRANGS